VKVWTDGSSVIRYYKADTRQKLRGDIEATVKEEYESVECWPSDFDPRPK